MNNIPKLDRCIHGYAPVGRHVACPRTTAIFAPPEDLCEHGVSRSSPVPCGSCGPFPTFNPTDQNPTLVHLDPAKMAQVANSRAAETETHRQTKPRPYCRSWCGSELCKEGCNPAEQDPVNERVWAATDANEHESGPLPVAFAGRVEPTKCATCDDTGWVVSSGEGTEPCPACRDRHGDLMTHLVIIAFGLLMAAVIVTFYLATNR